MRKNLFGLSVPVLLGALLGFFIGHLSFSSPVEAAPTPRTEEHNGQFNFRGGILVGETSKGTKVSRITKGTLDYDFPATAALNSGSSQRVCQSSFNVTVTGARFGDTCVVGVDQAVSTLVLYTAQVTAADTAIIQECAVGGVDGGVLNQADSGWTVRCFSS